MNDELFSENARTAPKSDGRLYANVGPLTTESGGFLPRVDVAYETWGELNEARDNAVLICHAVSGDSHAIGWWGKLIGPGKAIDTDRYFVIGNNLLGGCQGTTGPSSLAQDGKPYGSRFPFITVGDMVEIQSRLVNHLVISKLHAVIGGSMGGFLALDWSTRFPDRVRKVFVTACCARATAMHIGFHETARQAIQRDPKWRNGDYALDDAPVQGLAVARMLGHLTYLSPQSFEAKFARRYQDKPEPDYTFGPEFEVESYLRYQAEGFTKRFDANSWLYLSRAVDYFDLQSLQGSQAEYLFACFTSDWFYPRALTEELHQMALAAGRPSQVLEIDLPYGHDAFLLDGEQQGAALASFLEHS
jgi:homoserine O-acetyltransferase